MKNETYCIQTDGLTRRFKTVVAVDHLTIQVPTGSIFGFLGPNGSGKTTTIRLLLGLLRPDAGHAMVLGYDTASQAAQIREASGAQLEHTGLYERISAYANLDFYGRVWHLSAQERGRRIQELLSTLGLWERRNETVVDWSRGMKQKLAIARALLHQPRLVFLDEPTAGLDPVAAAALRDDLLVLAKQQGVTVFLTTHNLPEAEKLCDQVAVIKQGRLLSVDTPDHLRMRQGTQELKIVASGLTADILQSLAQQPGVQAVKANGSSTTLTLAPDAKTPALLRWLILNGVEVEEARKGSASLEEAFLQLLEEDHVN
ncbi:MAG: ABC transporter ATP-binding protein [Anaerolineae bacterium]|nr:ABC transporter ATP-binding protein [Anaerolineae bacterium]